MVSLAGLRNRLQSKVFGSNIASTAVISNQTSSTIDKWGDRSRTLSSGTTASVVPFTYINKELSYQPFGDLQSDQVDLILPHDTTLGEKDRIVWQSTNYFIEQIDKSAYIENGLVVLIVRARKEA